MDELGGRKLFRLLVESVIVVVISSFVIDYFFLMNYLEFFMFIFASIFDGWLMFMPLYFAVWGISFFMPKIIVGIIFSLIVSKFEFGNYKFKNLGVVLGTFLLVGSVLQLPLSLISQNMYFSKGGKIEKVSESYSSFEPDGVAHLRDRVILKNTGTQVISGSIPSFGLVEFPSCKFNPNKVNLKRGEEIVLDIDCKGSWNKDPNYFRKLYKKYPKTLLVTIEIEGSNDHDRREFKFKTEPHNWAEE